MNAEAPPVAFVDTNIFVYALAGRHDKAFAGCAETGAELMLAQALRTSTQVLQDYSSP